jgi:GNAT superfamily N-acetyltransferase
LIVKATLASSGDDEQPGAIVGWASWLHEDPSGRETDRTVVPASLGPGENAAENQGKLMEFNQGLGTFIRGRQKQIYTNWWKKRILERDASSTTSGFLSLRSCFVLPEFQRHGVGSALVRYGCERADRLMLDCLVTSTPAAKRLYQNVGEFEILEWLDVDLTEWGATEWGAAGNENEGQDANSYRVWFLYRTFRLRDSLKV